MILEENRAKQAWDYFVLNKKNMPKLQRCSGLIIAVQVILSGFLVVSLQACSQTVESQAAVAKQVGSGAPAVSGFFGSDISLLQPGSEGQAAMVYLNTSVQ